MNRETECGNVICPADDDWGTIVGEELRKEYWQDRDSRIKLYIEASSHLNDNDLYLKRLEQASPLRRFFMKHGVNRKFRENSQALHKITIELVVQLYKWMNQLIEGQAKLWENDQRLEKKIEELENGVDFDEWFIKQEKQLPEGQCQRLLAMVSGWHEIDPGGEVIQDRRQLQRDTIERLGLKDIALSPKDFVDEFLEASLCGDSLVWLVPYVEEVWIARSQLSEYGALLCEIYDLCSSPQVRRLAAAAPEKAIEACRSVLRPYSEQREGSDVEKIFGALIRDLQKGSHKRELQNADGGRLKEQKNYRLAVVSPEGIWLYGLDSSDCRKRAFEAESDFSLSDNNIWKVREELEEFQPSLVIVPGAEEERWREALGDRLADVPRLPMADFYYRLWQSGLSGAENLNRPDADPPACVVLFDYYAHKIWVSCFGKETDGIRHRQEPVKYNRNKAKIVKDVRDWLEEIGLDIPEGKIVYCYTFRTDKYIDTKMDSDKIGAKPLGREWQDKLRDPENLKAVMDKLLPDEQKKEDM